jgi:hypothetical protein
MCYADEFRLCSIKERYGWIGPCAHNEDMKTRSGGMAPFISTSALEGYEWSDACTSLVWAVRCMYWSVMSGQVHVPVWYKWSGACTGLVWVVRCMHWSVMSGQVHVPAWYEWSGACTGLVWVVRCMYRSGMSGQMVRCMYWSGMSGHMHVLAWYEWSDACTGLVWVIRFMFWSAWLPGNVIPTLTAKEAGWASDSLDSMDTNIWALTGIKSSF